MCPHGLPEMYESEWSKWYERYHALDGGVHFHWGCFCKPPDRFQIRRMEDELLIMSQARSEEKRKVPATSGKDKTENDDSAGRWYLITFTQPETIKDPHDLLKRTQKVIRSKQVSAIQWCYSLELTDKGTPHTHIRLFTNKYFDYKKIGNFNNGYRYDIQTEKFSSEMYVVKDASKPSMDWLLENDLDRFFWCSENYVGARPDILPDQNLISHV